MNGLLLLGLAGAALLVLVLTLGGALAGYLLANRSYDRGYEAGQADIDAMVGEADEATATITAAAERLAATLNESTDTMAEASPVVRTLDLARVLEDYYLTRRLAPAPGFGWLDIARDLDRAGVRVVATADRLTRVGGS